MTQKVAFSAKYGHFDPFYQLICKNEILICPFWINLMLLGSIQIEKLALLTILRFSNILPTGFDYATAMFFLVNIETKPT